MCEDVHPRQKLCQRAAGGVLGTINPASTRICVTAAPSFYAPRTSVDNSTLPQLHDEDYADLRRCDTAPPKGGEIRGYA